MAPLFSLYHGPPLKFQRLCHGKVRSVTCWLSWRIASHCQGHVTAMHARPKQRWHAGGFAIGFALGFLTKWLLSLLRSRGAKAPEEMALTVAMAYLAFYLANAPGIALARITGISLPMSSGPACHYTPHQSKFQFTFIIFRTHQGS